jgi:hypothetical protein
MNDKAMAVAMVVDRSGSMSRIASATVEGLNSFFTEQRTSETQTSLLIVQFDDHYEEVFRGPVQDAPIFTLEPTTSQGMAHFSPRGMTALLDAIGKTITELGKELEAMSEPDRPAKVVFVIMTDGEENASRHYSLPQIAKMIALQRDGYQWQFQFLAANQDAIATAAKMNIPSVNTVTYNASHAGTQSVMSSMSSHVRSYGVTGQSISMNYSAEDRADAMRDNDEDQKSAVLAGVVAQDKKAGKKRAVKQ